MLDAAVKLGTILAGSREQKPGLARYHGTAYGGPDKSGDAIW
jgi:hypothetical protein